MGWRPWLECAAISAAYVLPMRAGRQAPRNEPATIRQRAFTSLATCCLAWVPMWQALKRQTQDPARAWQLLPAALGMRSAVSALRAAATPLALTVALFLGPLALRAVDWLDERDANEQRRQRERQEGLSEQPQRPREPAEGVWARRARDYLVAPVTEEFVFRGCMAPLLLLGGTSLKRTVALVPLYFGAAHLHHLYELVSLQGRPVGQATQQVLAQFLYTSIFGWYATWLFVRSGHLAAPIAVHAACNALGFPDFERMSSHRLQPLLSAATAAGVVLFGVLLRPLTEPGFYGGGGLLGTLKSLAPAAA